MHYSYFIVFFSFAEKLKLTIPWKSLFSQPVVALVDGIYVLAVPDVRKLNIIIKFYSLFHINHSCCYNDISFLFCSPFKGETIFTKRTR